MHVDLVEFGERVLYQPLDHKSLGSAQTRWADGVFVGIRMNTGEKLIATTEGVRKARSIRRRAGPERWNANEIMKVTGSSWKPYLYTDKDELLSRPPPPAIIKDDSKERAGRETDARIVPRSFAITKKDLVNYGCASLCRMLCCCK